MLYKKNMQELFKNIPLYLSLKNSDYYKDIIIRLHICKMKTIDIVISLYWCKLNLLGCECESFTKKYT